MGEKVAKQQPSNTIPDSKAPSQTILDEQPPSQSNTDQHPQLYQVPINHLEKSRNLINLLKRLSENTISIRTG